MTKNERLERIRLGVRCFLQLAAGVEQATLAGHASKTLDADERLLLEVVDRVEKHIETTPIGRLRRNTIQFGDRQLFELRESIATILKRVEDDNADGDEALAQVARAFAEAHRPLDVEKLRKFLARGATENVAKAVRLKVRELSGPANAAARVVSKFVGREQGVRGYAQLSREKQVALELQARGCPPSPVALGHYALSVLELSPDDFESPFYANVRWYDEHLESAPSESGLPHGSLVPVAWPRDSRG